MNLNVSPGGPGGSERGPKCLEYVIISKFLTSVTLTSFSSLFAVFPYFRISRAFFKVCKIYLKQAIDEKLGIFSGNCDRFSVSRIEMHFLATWKV